MIRLLTLLILALPLLGQLVVPTRARLLYPIFPWTTSATTCTLNQVSTSDQCATIFRAPVGGSLTSVSFLTGTVSTSQSLTIDIQTVDADTGRPTGNLVAAGATGTQSSVAASTWYTVSLSTPPTITAGQVMATVIYFTGTAGNLGVSQGMSGEPLTDGGTYAINQDNGTWGSRAALWPRGLITVGGCVHPMGNHLSAGVGAVTSDFGSNSSPNEYGNRIAAAAYTARAVGVYAWLSNTSANSSIVARLYDASGALIASSAAYDGDQLHGSNRAVFFPFTTPVIIQRGRPYDVVLSPQNTNTIRMTYHSWVSAADLAGALDYGGDIYLVSRGTGGGVNTTQRVWITLVLDAVYAGSGGFMVVQ